MTSLRFGSGGWKVFVAYLLFHLAKFYESIFPTLFQLFIDDDEINLRSASQDRPREYGKREDDGTTG